MRFRFDKTINTQTFGNLEIKNMFPNSQTNLVSPKSYHNDIDLIIYHIYNFQSLSPSDIF